MDIKCLKKLCEKLEAEGFGDSEVYISEDDEGNSLREMVDIDINYDSEFSIISDDDVYTDEEDEELDDTQYIVCLY